MRDMCDLCGVGLDPEELTLIFTDEWVNVCPDCYDADQMETARQALSSMFGAA